MHSVFVLSVAAATLLSQGAEAVSSSTRKPTAFSESASLSKSENYASLTKVKSAGGSNRRSAAYLKGLTTATTTNGTTGLISLIEGEEFATSIIIGTQTFEVILDTGSSDTWVVESDFECVDVDTDKETSESTCGFGTTFTVDSTFSEIKGEEFDIEYGDGEFLEGVFGTETVTIAGITVENQTIALATYAGWDGDGTTSGLTGFAYPAL
jgi:Eukaryotic aspartyl protease